MKRALLLLTAAALVSLTSESRAQSWTSGYVTFPGRYAPYPYSSSYFSYPGGYVGYPYTTGYLAYPGGYSYATPGVYPFYTYSVGGIYARPAVYGPTVLRPMPNYAFWVNAGYPFRTYNYYARYSAAFPTYGYIYGYPYYAAGYRGFYLY